MTHVQGGRPAAAPFVDADGLAIHLLCTTW
jgi:hypothetical protein